VGKLVNSFLQEEESITMFPSPCFYAYFEVSHQKRVMGKRSLEVDLCEKELIQIMGDGNTFAE